MTDRPTLEDLDAPLESSRWCCDGNAEDCALCTDPNPPYPFLCPGHPRTTANERIVGETAQPATEATNLDKKRRYLRPVQATIISDDPDGVHLAVYEWLPMFDAWATGPALCGESMRQGPLPEGTEVTCGRCLDWQPEYEQMLAVQHLRASGRAVREVRIVVEAPSEENADQWATTIRDLVLAEHGEDMRLDVTIHPGGRP